MRVAVVGGGAMGGALAVEATLAGHEVSVLDVDEALVARIRADGLSVRDGDRTLRAKPSATSDPAEIGPVDVVVVFVKAQHTRAAATAVRSLIDGSTVVVSLQNGWGNTDVIAEVLGADRLVFGVTYHSCSVVGLGEIAHTGRAETFVGPYEGKDLASAQLVLELLTSSGWPGVAIADVRTEIWKKLVLNAATLATAALTTLQSGQLDADPAMHALIDGLACEATAVARALGLDIDPDERVARIHAVLANAGPGRASMLQDALGRRKTEIEVVNGAVVQAADGVGVSVPLNRTMVALIAGLERSWRS